MSSLGGSLSLFPPLVMPPALVSVWCLPDSRLPQLFACSLACYVGTVLLQISGEARVRKYRTTGRGAERKRLRRDDWPDDKVRGCKVGSHPSDHQTGASWVFSQLGPCPTFDARLGYHDVWSGYGLASSSRLRADDSALDQCGAAGVGFTMPDPPPPCRRVHLATREAGGRVGEKDEGRKISV